MFLNGFRRQMMNELEEVCRFGDYAIFTDGENFYVGATVGQVYVDDETLIDVESVPSFSSWQDIVGLLTEGVRAVNALLVAARKELLPEATCEDMWNFRKWLVSVGQTTAVQHDEVWERLHKRFSVDKLRFRTLQFEGVEVLIAPDETLRIQRSAEPGKNPKLTATELIGLSILMLCDQRTEVVCLEQYGPFLLVGLELHGFSKTMETVEVITDGTEPQVKMPEAAEAEEVKAPPKKAAAQPAQVSASKAPTNSPGSQQQRSWQAPATKPQLTVPTQPAKSFAEWRSSASDRFDAILARHRLKR